MKQIMIIDDELNMCKAMKMVLEKDGYEVVFETSSAAAVKKITANNIYDLVITDLKMPEMDGLEVLKRIKSAGVDLPIIMLTAYGTIDVAVEALKLGVVDFITKPFNKDVILNTVRKILEFDHLKLENQEYKKEINSADMIYCSSTMLEIMSTLDKISSTNIPVLITGETGVGKGMLAREIYKRYTAGKKSDGNSFIKINCPSIPESLFESELFGHKKGAFTGAISDYKGKARLADGGVLFLDEIGDLPLNMQSKMLRLIEDKCFEAVGSNTTIHVDIKVVCATNCDLTEMINLRKFREDLFYRINTISIDLPPLRERKDEIINLAEYFIKHFSAEMNKPAPVLNKDAKKRLAAYEWPGNIRELKNIIERAVLLFDKAEFDGSEFKLPEVVFTDPEDENENILENNEKKLMLKVLEETSWNVSLAATRLGISRSTMRYRMDKYKLKDG